MPGTILSHCLLLIILLALLYLGFLLTRPWYANWGASAEERTMSLPGDQLALNAKAQTTRAITINTRPENVWPWIIQMGYQRAGWYNYDFLNRMMGATDFVDGHHSARRIVPELQHLQPGDEIRIAPPIAYTVKGIVPARSLVLHGQSETENHIWTYCLYEQMPG